VSAEPLPSPGPATDRALEAPAPAAPPPAAKPDPAAHLKDHRWTKGKSGNPGGRPKGKSVTAALRALAESEHNGRPVAELLAEQLMKQALSGKFPFAKEVLERLDGKVADTHKLEGTTGQRLYICPPPRVLGEGKPGGGGGDGG
jgi:Family of unknown function (DUF5681)